MIVSSRTQCTAGPPLELDALPLRRAVHVVVATPEFGAMLTGFVEHVRGVENLRILVFGRDEVSAIPDAMHVPKWTAARY